MLPFLSRNLLHNVRASWLTEQSLSAAPRFEQLTTEQVVLLRAAALRRADYPDDFDLMARFAPSSRGKQTAHELPLQVSLDPVASTSRVGSPIATTRRPS